MYRDWSLPVIKQKVDAFAAECAQAAGFKDCKNTIEIFFPQDHFQHDDVFTLKFTELDGQEVITPPDQPLGQCFSLEKFLNVLDESFGKHDSLEWWKEHFVQQLTEYKQKWEIRKSRKAAKTAKKTV